MKSSRSPISLFHGGLAALLIAGATLSGCTDNASVQTPNEQDVQAATEVMASTLSDQEDGVVASMYDATSVATPTGMTPMSSANNTGNTYTITAQNGPNGNGNGNGKGNGPMHGRSSNYTYTYDPATGIHHITFTRDITRANFEKTLNADLQFIYRDSLGNFVEHPRLDGFQSLGSVDFIGKKEGSAQNQRRNSTFSRIDTLYYSNLQQSSDAITINGAHHGEGDMIVNPGSGSTIERKYKVYLEFTDVSIARSSIINQDLEQGVTGTLTYDVYIYHDNNGVVTENTISGNALMTGDGSALLKFKGWRPQYLIKLATGDITQQ